MKNKLIKALLLSGILLSAVSCKGGDTDPSSSEDSSGNPSTPSYIDPEDEPELPILFLTKRGYQTIYNKGNHCNTPRSNEIRQELIFNDDDNEEVPDSPISFAEKRNEQPFRNKKRTIIPSLIK